MGVKLCEKEQSSLKFCKRENILSKQMQPTIICGINEQNTLDVLFHTCSQNERIQSTNGKSFSRRTVVDSILTVDCNTDSNHVSTSDIVFPCNHNIAEHGSCDLNDSRTERQIIQTFPNVLHTSSSGDNAITNDCMINSIQLDNKNTECSSLEESKHVHFASNEVNNDSKQQIVELVACGAICAFNDDVEICKNSSCQIPLKLTNTGLSHTVYELFPSNTFCDSNGTGHDHDNCEYEGLGSTDKTTVPFTKQETSTQQTNLHTNEKGWSSDIGSIADEQLEPLAYDSNVVSETGADKGLHYKQKAADRGTLYCACGGIAAVAVIVILLINFS